MKCPACERTLESRKVDSLAVDVCLNGCGGTWFDRKELDAVDESDEAAGEALVAIQPVQPPDLFPVLKRACPRCDRVIMQRHFFTIKRQVEVDECPNCGGYWLDAGELATIREEYESAEERERAADKYMSGMSAPARDLSRQNIASANTLRQTARMLRMFGRTLP